MREEEVSESEEEDEPQLPPPPPASPTLRERLRKHMQWLHTHDLMLFILAWLYVILCPFAKVEESFNLHAIHDLLYTPTLSKFDHHEFPGVVPRTFLGALAVAAPSWPLVQVVKLLELPKLVSQYVVRLVLGSMSVISLLNLKRVVTQRYGGICGSCYTTILMCQFHWLFYCSRTLPNTFAGILTNVCFSLWLNGQWNASIGILVVAIVVFRGELLLLGVALGLKMIQVRGLGVILPAAAVCLMVGALSLAVSIAVDSVFWGRMLWPEGEVLFFNTVQNRSNEYGTSPWHWYFTNALPKSMLGALPLVLYAYYLDHRCHPMVEVSLGFVALYSFLPHKELRFILYVVPLLDIAAARSLGYLYINFQKRKKNADLNLLTAAMMLIASASFCMLVFLISTDNYPAGHALQKLHQLEATAEQRYVHIDEAAAMTGISLFGEHSDWHYSKLESATAKQLLQFSHLITAKTHMPGFTRIYQQYGYNGIKKFPPSILRTPKIFLMHRQQVQ